VKVEKVDCRVAGRFDGLACIVEQEYHNRTFRYGHLDLACSAEEVRGLLNKEVEVRLADGRFFMVYIFILAGKNTAAPTAGEGAECCVLAYYFAVSPLATSFEEAMGEMAEGFFGGG